MAQRLVRAKGKIRDAGIPYRVPPTRTSPSASRRSRGCLPDFQRGLLGDSGERLARRSRARRSGWAVACSLPLRARGAGPAGADAARRVAAGARVDATGALVLLADQDRARWDRTLIAEGQAIVRRCLRHNRPDPIRFRRRSTPCTAMRRGRHRLAADLALYDQLIALTPSPVVALNRAVAVAEVHGPDAALTLVDGLDLDRYYLFHAVRADLLPASAGCRRHRGLRPRHRAERERRRTRVPDPQLAGDDPGREPRFTPRAGSQGCTR